MTTFVSPRNLRQSQWIQFSLTHLTSVVIISSVLQYTLGHNIKPTDQELLSSQLCPSPIYRRFADTKNDNVEAVVLDKDWTLYDRILPCSFKLDNGNAVKVRSINLNSQSWNFSSANTCDRFMKFKGPYNQEFLVLCGREQLDQFLGPYGHPMILYYRWQESQMTFPLFHSGYGLPEDRINTVELKYMLIYFSIYRNNTWHCRVQEYRLDMMRKGCDKQETSCGEYNCDELDRLYKSQMTIFRDGESDKLLVWKAKSEDKYRMRTFLRQKFVPVVFLVVLIFAYKSYMKAGFRLNPISTSFVESRLRRNNPRSFAPHPYYPRLDDAFWDDATPPQRPPPPPYDSLRPPPEVSTDAPAYDPPSYDSLSQNQSLPTYSEATKKPTNA